jgi:hypothetical protein
MTKMTKRVLLPEQWQVIDRLRLVGCPIDHEALPTPLHVFAEPLCTQVLPLVGGAAIAFFVRVVAGAPITIHQFHLRADWLKNEISWLRFCDQHSDDLQKHYCFPECSGGNIRFPSAAVLNHRTLNGGVLRRFGFISGLLLGTFPDALPPTGIGTKLQATLSIEDLFGHEYRFPIVLLDHTTESHYEDWMCQVASARGGGTVSPTENTDEVM